MAQRLLLVVLCCFIFLKQADAYKVVQIENVEAKPEENSVEFKIQFSHASDLPRGFRMTDWGGMGGCNWIHPCDWIGIWKEDKRDSDQGCKETSEGWKCPYSTQYTSGHDLVKRAGYMSVDMYKELTPTTKDSRYHVYYCLTPQYIRKWTSYVEFRARKKKKEFTHTHSLTHSTRHTGTIASLEPSSCYQIQWQKRKKLTR